MFKKVFTADLKKYAKKMRLPLLLISLASVALGVLTLRGYIAFTEGKNSSELPLVSFTVLYLLLLAVYLFALLVRFIAIFNDGVKAREYGDSAFKFLSAKLTALLAVIILSLAVCCAILAPFAWRDLAYFSASVFSAFVSYPTDVFKLVALPAAAAAAMIFTSALSTTVHCVKPRTKAHKIAIYSFLIIFTVLSVIALITATFPLFWVVLAFRPMNIIVISALCFICSAVAFVYIGLRLKSNAKTAAQKKAAS